MQHLLIAPILPLDELARRLPAGEWERTATLSAERRRQTLTWRAMVWTQCPGVQIEYNAVGAPTIAGGPHLSVSHTARYAVVVLSDAPCAVDIESLNRNFERVATRYATAEERQLPGGELLLPALWCAKEALYKYAGRRGLDFLQDLRVEKFDLLQAPATENPAGPETPAAGPENPALVKIGRMTGRVANGEPVTLSIYRLEDHLLALIANEHHL